MGDMKTPDFDDLLAAFDIPDATSLDAKEAIQESQDEEGHLKHSEICMDATMSVPHPVTTSDAPAVSVIVKNTNRQDPFEPLLEKETSQLGHLLQNGFRSPTGSLESHIGSHSNYTMLDTSPLNGDCSESFLEKIPMAYKTEKVTPLSKSLSDFSPISSPESEDIQKNGNHDFPDHGDSFFPNDSLFVSADTTVSDSQAKPETYSMTDKCRKRDPGSTLMNNSSSDAIPHRGENGECSKQDEVEKRCNEETMDYSIVCVGSNAYPTPETNPSTPPPCVKTQNLKPSSCIDALDSLNMKDESGEHTNPRDLLVTRKEMMKVSPKVSISPRSPRSPLEVVKRLIKQPESPVSICSDSSGKASPALATGSPPAIPRVRIKTIKTSSGQIKRTVTSIFPDSETEDLQSPFGSSPSQSSVEDAFSKTLPMCHSHDIGNNVIFENGKQERSKLPLLGRTTSIESVRSSNKSQSQNTNCGLKRTPRVNKQKRASPAQTGCPTNPNYLPKALHLANLNLVPHSVAASVTARSSNHREHSQLSSPTVCSSVPLVHQVKKTSPNTRAIIPNTAAGTLNRLLNYSNPVPTYVPNLSPPPDSNITFPPHGYCCLECGDSFGLEKSLAFHYSRRSVHIEVACTNCSKTLVFFNRCALLAHARDHKNKGMMMQCSQLFMKPIAVDQMFVPTKPEQFVSHMTQRRSNVQSSKNLTAMPLYPDKVIQHGLKCLECNKQMLDYAALAGHYQRSSTDSEGLMCKVCTMLLPNKCSYRAHQRIHNHKSPYCCPECGALSHSADLQKHVKENCLHYARKVGYSCLHCETLFMSLTLLKKHIEEKHCEVLYKCTICPVAFKSSDGAIMHMKSKHAGCEPSHQLIHKCSCETVFKKKQLLYQHLHQRTCIFRCPECTSFFLQKIALVHHFKVCCSVKCVHMLGFVTVPQYIHNGSVYYHNKNNFLSFLQGAHGAIFRSETEDGAKLEAESLPHLLKSVPANHQPKQTKPSNGTEKEFGNCSTSRKPTSGLSMKNAGWTCGECLLWLPDRETYVGHMKTTHGKSVKRNPCRLCERSFNSSTSLRRHIRNDHDGKKKVYTCWFCTNERVTFTKHSALKNHLSLMHGIKNPDFNLMTKLDSQETNKVTGMCPKRAAEKVHDKGGSGALDASPAKRLKPVFRCAKCGLTTEDPEQFKEHIPKHKTDSDTPQCQRCGLCFTSRLALSRHLYIVHKVKGIEEQKGNTEDLSGPKCTDLLDGKEFSTNLSGTCQRGPLSAEKIGLGGEVEPPKLLSETCCETVSLESLDSTMHSGMEVQASGSSVHSVEEGRVQ